MNHSKFAIGGFENRNGKTSWRVEGRIDGVRFRRNFKTKEEAVAEKGILDLKYLQLSSNIRSATTFLTDPELRQAEAAYQRLGKNPVHPLLFYLEFGLANYREPQASKPLAEAVADYVDVKTKQFERTLLSRLQLKNIVNGLKALQARFPKAAMADFTPDVLLSHLEQGKPSLKTYNNRRGILSTFFKFGWRKNWLPNNPVERTPHHRIAHRRGSAVTIDAGKAEKLMAHVEDFRGGAMVPYFAICLFAGIRPCIRFGEMSKLKAESVRTDIGSIHIEPDVSKTREKRLVPIQPNLAAWLRAYPLEKNPILPTNYQDYRWQIFNKFGLTHDITRHTWISMVVAKYRSIGEAALQAGNSESIIRKHYLDLKSAEEAGRYFGIMPKRRINVEAVVVPMPRGEVLAAV